MRKSDTGKFVNRRQQTTAAIPLQFYKRREQANLPQWLEHLVKALPLPKDIPPRLHLLANMKVRHRFLHVRLEYRPVRRIGRPHRHQQMGHPRNHVDIGERDFFPCGVGKLNGLIELGHTFCEFLVLDECFFEEIVVFFAWATREDMV